MHLVPEAIYGFRGVGKSVLPLWLQWVMYSECYQPGGTRRLEFNPDWDPCKLPL